MLTVTFQIDLTPDHIYGHRPPYDYSQAPTFAANRLVLLPDMFDSVRQLRHGDRFTLTGQNAVYMRSLVTGGQVDCVKEVSAS